MSFVLINYAHFVSALLEKKTVTESLLQTRFLRLSLISECFVSRKAILSK